MTKLTRADNHRRCRKHLDGSITRRPVYHLKDLGSDRITLWTHGREVQRKWALHRSWKR